MIQETLTENQLVAALPKLRLGSGILPKEQGWVNLDMEPGPEVDVVHDMTVLPWPFPDGHFGAIEASHVLEHIPMVDVETPKHKKRDALLAVMEEMWRVLAPGGRVYVEVPSVHGQGAFQDYSHRRFWVENSMYYFARPPRCVEGTAEYEEGCFQRFVAAKNIPFSRLQKMGTSDMKALREESVEWARTDEGRPPEWDWNFHRGNYNIECRFDCLRAEYTGGQTSFLIFYLRKPER